MQMLPFSLKAHNSIGFGFAASPPPTAGPSKSPSKRRKRSETPEGEEQEEMAAAAEAGPKRIKSESYKRFKAPSKPGEDVDLGKLLGSWRYLLYYARSCKRRLIVQAGTAQHPDCPGHATTFPQAHHRRPDPPAVA
jgi:hypothetical protein